FKMAVARTWDAECRRRSISVICPRCSNVLRSSCIRRAEINHEGHEGHEEICRDGSRGLMRYIYDEPTYCRVAAADWIGCCCGMPQKCPFDFGVRGRAAENGAGAGQAARRPRRARPDGDGESAAGR